MRWIDEELAKDTTLAERVEAELARLRVEQDLAALRVRRGVSQRQLARMVGVSQPVIARMEAGRARNLELRTLVKIASALDSEVRISLHPRLRSKRAREGSVEYTLTGTRQGGILKGMSAAGLREKKERF